MIIPSQLFSGSSVVTISEVRSSNVIGGVDSSVVTGVVSSVVDGGVDIGGVVSSEIDELVYPDNCDIVINVGVSHKARTVLTLETQACGKSYCKTDVENVIKHDSKCTLEEEKNDTKFTRINVDYVISKLKCSSVKSTDAGRYLCEYVFYKSLGLQKKSLFVHVCEEEIHSVEETADGLFELIEILVNSYKC